MTGAVRFRRCLAKCACGVAALLVLMWVWSSFWVTCWRCGNWYGWLANGLVVVEFDELNPGWCEAGDGRLGFATGFRFWKKLENQYDMGVYRHHPMFRLWMPERGHPAIRVGGREILGEDWRVAIPLWMPLVVVAIISILLCPRSFRRRQLDCCQDCGYNLHGLTEPRCPECGAPFDPSRRPPGVNF